MSRTMLILLRLIPIVIIRLCASVRRHCDSNSDTSLYFIMVYAVLYILHHKHTKQRAGHSYFNVFHIGENCDGAIMTMTASDLM